VNNIVFTFQKKDAQHIINVVKEMRNHFKLNKIRKLKWFLGIHIFRDRIKRSL